MDDREVPSWAHLSVIVTTACRPDGNISAEPSSISVSRSHLQLQPHLLPLSLLSPGSASLSTHAPTCVPAFAQSDAPARNAISFKTQHTSCGGPALTQ